MTESSNERENWYTFGVERSTYKGRRIVLSYIPDDFFMFTIEGKDDESLSRLVDSFSSIVGYDPFCKYNRSINGDASPTYEWRKIGPEARFLILSRRSNVEDLFRI